MVICLQSDSKLYVLVHRKATLFNIYASDIPDFRRQDSLDIVFDDNVSQMLASITKYVKQLVETKMKYI